MGCLLTAGLRAGGGRSAPKVEIEIPVFAGGYGTSFYEETARQFESLRPGVHVQLYGDPRIADKVRVRVIDGSYPDAACVGEVLWPALIRSGRLLDLTPYLAGPDWDGDARWSDTFVPGAGDCWRVNGGTFGLPFNYACWSIFYDKTLFRAHGWSEPRTWSEFFALCDRIRATGRAPLSVPGVYLRYVDAFLRAAHYNLVGPAGWRDYNDLAPGARTDERFVRAAGVLQSLRPYLLPGWEGMTHTAAQRALLNGEAAMTVSGSWLVNEMKGRFPRGFELGTMNFPVFSDGLGDPTMLQTGSDYFFVFATGDPLRERATVDFLRFLTSRGRAEAWVRTVDSPVAVRGVPEAAYSEFMRDTARLIEHSRTALNVPPNMLQPPGLLQAMTDLRWRLMTGQITPRDFAERLEAAAARERAREVNPTRVEIRHPFAAAALLAIVAGAAGILAAASRRRTRGTKAPTDGGDSPSAEGAYLGRLRGPVALGFVGPALLLYGAVVLVPCVGALIWAFTRWDGISARTWVGWFNFKWLLFESDVFWSALGNNLYLMLVPASVVVPLALLLAALIHRGVWAAGVFRVIFLFPNILGGIAATLLWMNAYDPHGGLVNAALVKFGGLLVGLNAPAALAGWFQSFDGYAWLSPANLYRALIPVYLWMACGFNLVLYLAAMEGIDPQLYEAAELDGAPAWRQFVFITLPLIWEVLAISVVFLVIGGLNTFELIWLLTSQDPSTSTHVLSTLMVTTMFKEFAIGRATAIAVVMFLLVFLGSAGVLRAMRREVVEQ